MEQTKLEKYLEDTLLEKLGNGKGKDIYGYYQAARSYLMTNILPNIKATESELTDHSEKHIENVLDNVRHLLENSVSELTEFDLYILCLSVLFHDAGNINGREEHNKKILGIYNTIRSNDSNFNTERTLVLNAVKAHCGKTNTGSRNTLTEVDIKSHLWGEPIQLREIAAILRFADELAEGPQRTADYLLDTNKISDVNKKYHKYAQITAPFIDRGNERIVLRYDIDIKNETPSSLKEILFFAYERILKLDEERRYAKFHSKLLEPFKKTEVSFSFNKEGDAMFIIDKIVLQDTCVVPGENQLCTTDLTSQFEALNIDEILNKLNLSE